MNFRRILTRTPSGPAIAVIILLLSATPGRSASTGEPEDILFQEIPSVFTASKYEQKVTEAPSAVSIVTSAEIRKFGYRTLADILRSLRGFQTTYDRQTQFVGVRGFGRPGDFNTRILLLIDGVRQNNNIFDAAALGAEFPLDVDLIDRVEVVRGPGSSLYGSNAFFAVINVITRRGRDLQGAEISAEAASLETYRGRISYGDRLPGGTELLLSGTWYDSQGHSTLYFPEFDTPATSNGLAKDGDEADAYQLFGRFSLQNFTLETTFADFDKHFPTAAFGTEFNDPRNRIGGSQGAVNLQYQKLYANQLELLARAAYGRFRGDGDFVYDFGVPGTPFLVVNRDDFSGDWWGAEIQLGKTLFDRHRLVAGAEVRDNFRQNLKNSDLAINLDARQSSENLGLFLQDDIQVSDRLTLNLGLRYDHFDTFGGTASPRLALIFNPWENTAWKLLYGEAFRAPSAFENHYHDGLVSQKPGTDLDPEKIRTYELVWEQFFRERVRGVATGYYYRIDDLINLTMDPADGLLVFRNLDEVEAYGLELELEGRWKKGLEGRVSYSAQKTENRRTGEELTNSPRHLIKTNLILPLWPERLFLGVEEHYSSSRKTVMGNRTGGFAVTNLTLFGRKVLPGLELSASIYNLWDKRFRDPVSAAHVQDTIEQDGRIFRGKLTYSF